MTHMMHTKVTFVTDVRRIKPSVAVVGNGD